MITPTGVVVAVVGLLVAAFVGWVIHHENSSVTGAGQAVGYTPQPVRPAALWIGDSYTAATGAPTVGQGEAALTSKALGWDYAIDAEGGTGFLDPGVDGSGNTVLSPARRLLYVWAARNLGEPIVWATSSTGDWRYVTMRAIPLGD